MPQICEYLNCHRLGSSTWYGYCTEAHYLRGIRDPVEKEKIEKRNFDQIIAIVKKIEENEKKPKEKEESKPQ